MKNTFFAIGAAVALLLPAACSGDRCGANAGRADKDGKEKVYTGVIPAADADGIRYTLNLDYSDDHEYTTGNYDLLETYIVGDTLSATGFKDAASFKSEGDFKVERKDGKEYIRLTQDAKDSSAGSNAGPIIFLVDSDSTITMVGADFQPASNPGMNYTLKLAK